MCASHRRLSRDKRSTRGVPRKSLLRLDPCLINRTAQASYASLEDVRSAGVDLTPSQKTRRSWRRNKSRASASVHSVLSTGPEPASPLPAINPRICSWRRRRAPSQSATRTRVGVSCATCVRRTPEPLYVSQTLELPAGLFAHVEPRAALSLVALMYGEPAPKIGLIMRRGVVSRACDRWPELCRFPPSC
jgi:hypothetical protein